MTIGIDLSGNTAIVAGSTAGIGLAIARALAAAGAEVIVSGRDRAKLDEAVRSLGGDVRGVAADLDSADGCAALVANAPDSDIVVGNLGLFEPKDFFETDDADWRHSLEANVLPGVRLARAYLPVMRDKGWGRFILVASESAVNVTPDAIHYGTAKAAVTALARGLAKLMAGTGVTVNSVLPGPTMTEAFGGFLAQQGEWDGRSADEVGAAFVTSHRPSSIIGRMISVDEVANMVAYLASPLSSATTGAGLRVDGGIIDTPV